MSTLRELARELYSQGMPLIEVAERVGRTRQTVYKWKKQDAARGLDWDRLRLENTITDDQFRKRQQAFLVEMFTAFEKDREKLSEIDDPEKRLELIDRYANVFYKLMNAAKRAEPEIAVSEVVTKTVRIIGDLASRSDRADVLQFLLDHLEDVKEAVLREL